MALNAVGLLGDSGDVSGLGGGDGGRGEVMAAGSSGREGEGVVFGSTGLTQGQRLTLVLLYGVWAWVCLGQNKGSGLGDIREWAGLVFGIYIKGPVW